LDFAEELFPLTIFQAMRNATLPMISHTPGPIQETKAIDGDASGDWQRNYSGDLAVVDVTAHG
jgi:hypothetical protein